MREEQDGLSSRNRVDDNWKALNGKDSGIRWDALLRRTRHAAHHTSGDLNFLVLCVHHGELGTEE